MACRTARASRSSAISSGSPTSRTLEWRSASTSGEIFSILASAGILYYLYRAKDEPFGFRLSLALILGGAVGNLIDRAFYGVIFGEADLFYGRVVDFIDVDFFNVSVFGYSLHRWPVFNIADASVTCGVLLMLIFHRKTPGVAAPVQAAPAVAEQPPGHEQSGA
jgi:signal peptidase II